MKNLALVFILFSLFVSCEKDQDGAFSGITKTDEQGSAVGSVDRTDWRFDDVWNRKEEALFNPNNFSSVKNSFHTQDSTIGVGFITESRATAYPNPAKEVLIFTIKSDADTIMFVMVDGGYNMILAKKHIGGNGSWSVDVSNRQIFKTNRLYRIYYKLEYADHNAERGHGDFKVID
jgi:hypothetical protein